jgi:hypothetical protein
MGGQLGLPDHHGVQEKTTGNAAYRRCPADSADAVQVQPGKHREHRHRPLQVHRTITQRGAQGERDRRHRRGG